MTTLGSTDTTRWVAGWVPLPAVDPLAGAEAWGEPSVYWERPLAREAVAGWGEAGAVEATSAREARAVLARLSAPDTVRWLEAPAGLPGPWFGGMRFSEEGGDAGWSPFGFGRWTLPEVLVWRTEQRLALAVFAPEGDGAEDGVRARLARASASSAAVVSGTSTCGWSTACETIAPAAPCANACAAKRWPSVLSPVIATNRSPAR